TAERKGTRAGTRRPRHRVRGRHARREREDRGEGRDPQAVAERPRHQALRDHDLIVRDGQPARQERRHAQELGLRLERGQELPEERGPVSRERPPTEGVAERARPGSHAVTVPARSRRRYAHATAMTSANTTTLTAEPKPSCRIWKSARYAYTVSVSVVPAGPPPVSTN